MIHRPPSMPSSPLRPGGPRALRSAVLALLMLAASMMIAALPAAALKPITLDPQQQHLEITTLGEAIETPGDSVQVETAPGVDGAAGRMSVRAVTPGTSPRWLAFALHNPTDRTIELWLTADRYEAVGSGIVWPDLDSRRIAHVTNSAGFAPERIRSDRTDIFRLTIERGQTITYVAEIASERFPRVSLWQPVEFEQKQRERQLFNGIMLGITGLLAIFLTAVFAANHKSIFPSAALVAWCVLAVLCVDFGFWHKLFQMKPEDNAQYRAASEAALAASLVLFLFSFLRVNLWHGFARMLFVLWIATQLSVIAIAILDPRLAATVARMTMATIGLIGGVIVLGLAIRGLDRALALVPTWILFLVWLFGAGVTLTGQIAGEAVISGMVSGLVLITLLIGFTVTQFAFRSTEPVYGASTGERQLRLAAIEQAGVAVFEWQARRDEIRLDPQIETALGLGPGELPSKLKDFMSLLHPADRERVRLELDGIKERNGGALRIDVRLRHADSSYRSFEFDGATVPTTDRRALRCVGLVRDVTDAKRSQERLLHDAVHDSLTGLPNRELFLDRVRSAMDRARVDGSVLPTVIFFDVDKFKSVNSSFGLIVGDSILITLSRRLSRSLQPQDTLARLSGDEFGLLLMARRDPRELAALAEAFRQALRSPIRIAGQEIVLTGSIGVAMSDGTQTAAADLLREAEIAMRWAKRAGADRIEIFRPEMRAEKDDRVAIESDLRRAIDTRQLKLLYQPIVALSSEELVGFEALVRWEHPRLGMLSPAEFIPVAEETDLIVQLGSYVLGKAVVDLARWQKEFQRPEQPLFVSVNVSSRQLIKPDLVQEIRHVIGRAVLPPGALRLEVTESLVMENPEQATQILEMLRDAGVQLALDDFGTGYSSLAYLNRFPFDTIKIDQALVQSSSELESNAVIVRSIVALAHELGKRMIAEGVETAEDAAFLRSIGCQYAQGFYYGEPMTEADVGRLIRLIRKSDRRMRRRGLVRGQEKRKGGDSATPASAPTGAPSAVAATPAAPPVRPAAADGPLPPQGTPTRQPPAVPTGATSPVPGGGVTGPSRSGAGQPPGVPPMQPGPQPNGGRPSGASPQGSGLPPPYPAPASQRTQPPPTGGANGPLTAPPSTIRSAPPEASRPQSPPLAPQSLVPPALSQPASPAPPASRPFEPLPVTQRTAPPLPHMQPPPQPQPAAPQPPVQQSQPPREARTPSAPVSTTAAPPAAAPTPAENADAEASQRLQGHRVRAPRKANIGTLSPAVAASLAKLAGGTNRPPVPGAGNGTAGSDQPPVVRPPGSKASDAAE